METAGKRGKEKDKKMEGEIGAKRVKESAPEGQRETERDSGKEGQSERKRTHTYQERENGLGFRV
jgi:hypothetical protein